MGTAAGMPTTMPLTYQWTLRRKPTGSSAELVDASPSEPTLTVDVDGTYDIELVVSDASMVSNPDTVRITAATANSAPTANAGPDQNVDVEATVVLDGSGSSDADNDSLTYRWTLVTRPYASSAMLLNATQLYPTLYVDAPGDYVVQLVVNDGTVDSASDTVRITASTVNSAPTADAGSNQNVDVGTLVTVDGTGSSDPDNNDTLSYTWVLQSKPSGSTVSISSQANAEMILFTPDVGGAYVVRLTVSDGSASSTDTVTISVAAVITIDGATLYSQNCASCHSSNGTGMGLNLPSLTSSRVTSIVNGGHHNSGLSSRGDPGHCRLYYCPIK